MDHPGQHLFWITSRAAGTSALVLSSLSVCVGVLIGGRLMSGRGRGTDLRTLHEALSLSAIAMLLLHGFALLGDPFLHPSLLDISVPFVGAYRPVWTGLGILGGWGIILLGLSFYVRDRIGLTRWRVLHRFTALAWLLGVVHTIGSGTDAGSLWYLALLALPAIPVAVTLPARATRLTH
ncbi:MAG: ferric reductase-like transmembrane domain-containing protein [Solirubrobacteraceae bacterium]